jgi:hypothetical protein
MRKVNSNYFIVFTLIVSILSCHPKKKDDPQPSVSPVPQPTVKYYQDIRLYNQFTTGSIKHFFSISDSIFSDDIRSDFDICYINRTLGASAANYFILGSPADRTYTDKVYPGLTSSRYTSFYKVPSSFTYANFDSLNVSSSLRNFILTKCTLVLSDQDNQLAQALKSDDSYGWAANSVFGFKTSDGKYGLIKILSPPTGSTSNTDPLKNTPGVIRLDIKIEK